MAGKFAIRQLNTALRQARLQGTDLLFEETAEHALRAVLAGLPAAERRALAPHVANTPGRYARMLTEELLAGYRMDPAAILATDFPDGYDEIMLVKNISFYSLCAHHLLPFFGKAHVAYIPKGGKVVGLSKLARLVECYARRLQIQERMTTQISSALWTHLRPLGAACVVEAEHLCMALRGVEKPGAVTTTSSMLGVFRTKASSRAELLTLIK